MEAPLEDAAEEIERLRRSVAELAAANERLRADLAERARAENGMRDSEVDRRLLVDGVPALVVVMTPDGEVEHVNHQVLDYFGRSLAEMKGWRTNDSVHPDDRSSVVETFGRSITTGDAYEVEHRLRRFDGDYRWFQARGLALRDTGDRIVRWYVLLTDIEDGKRAEESLRASEDRLRKIINTLPETAWSTLPDAYGDFLEALRASELNPREPPDGTAMDVHDRRLAEEHLRQSERDARLIVDCIPAQVAVLTPTGEVKQVNRRMMDYFGSIEALGNWKTGDIVPPDELPGVLASMGKAFQTGQPFEMENHLRRFDGVYRWFNVRGHPLLDANGRPVRWYFLITDIEERKRTEEALRRSEAFLAEAQSISSTGSFSWLLDTDEIIFSEELYRIFELDENAVVTFEQIGLRTHPEDAALLSNSINQIRGSGGTFQAARRLRMPDGRIKYIRTFGKVIQHPDARRECIGAVQDVTQRHLSDEALDRARSELAHITRSMSLGALTASIAHEVNQPLSGIVTNASTCVRLLTADPPNVHGALETARRTIRDGNRAADVIARLRALFVKKAVATETVDLNDAAREVITLLSNDLRRNRVILRAELDDDSLLVSGDRVQLQQVILNLVRNASDAMSGVDDRPRHLLIRTERDEADHARVTVQDVGIGLDPAGANRLFDAFYTTKNDSMGIGLSVSRSIVERHSGRLWAVPNEGPGATFAFSIPCGAEAVSGSPNLMP